MSEKSMELSKRIKELFESKGITCKEINESLNIPKKFLVALENGKIEDFPPRVYVIGYLKEIAKILDVDEHELITLYEANNFVNEEQKIKYEPILEIDRKHGNLSIFFTLLVFVLIILGVLFLFMKKRGSNIPENGNMQNKEKTSYDNTSKLPNFTVKRDNVSKISMNNEKKGTLKVTKDNVSSDIFKEVKNKIKKHGIFVPNDNVTSNVKKKILLLAKKKVWVRVTLDNKTKKTFMIKKGDTREIYALKTIKLDIGNAGNLKMFVNGKEYPSFGKNGEVVHTSVSLDNVTFKSEQN